MKIQSELSSGFSRSFCGWSRLVAFFLMVVFFVPILMISRVLRIKAGAELPRIFHATLVRILGFKVRVRGKMEGGTVGADPTFFVSNHSSYLDVPVLGSVINGCFVAKSEVGTWPFIGTMARLQNTVFIERRAVRAGKQVSILRENLEKGNALLLFPEGTSSDGMRTLPFKSSLFSIVEKPLHNGKYVKVQPVSAICTEIGDMPIGRAWRPYYAWYGDMTLIKHVWDVFKIGGFTVDIIFHPAVTIEDFGDRKMLSQYCEGRVSEGVDQCVTGRFDENLAVIE